MNGTCLNRRAGALRGLGAGSTQEPRAPREPDAEASARLTHIQPTFEVCQQPTVVSPQFDTVGTVRRDARAASGCTAQCAESTARNKVNFTAAKIDSARAPRPEAPPPAGSRDGGHVSARRSAPAADGHVAKNGGVLPRRVVVTRRGAAMRRAHGRGGAHAEGLPRRARWPARHVALRARLRVHALVLAHVGLVARPAAVSVPGAGACALRRVQRGRGVLRRRRRERPSLPLERAHWPSPLCMGCALPRVLCSRIRRRRRVRSERGRGRGRARVEHGGTAPRRRHRCRSPARLPHLD